MPQMSSPQNAIMAIHIRPACHQTQPPPFQNIMVIISSRPGASPGRYRQHASQYPPGVVTKVPS